VTVCGLKVYNVKSHFNLKHKEYSVNLSCNARARRDKKLNSILRCLRRRTEHMKRRLERVFWLNVTLKSKTAFFRQSICVTVYARCSWAVYPEKKKKKDVWKCNLSGRKTVESCTRNTSKYRLYKTVKGDSSGIWVIPQSTRNQYCYKWCTPNYTYIMLEYHIYSN